MILAIESSCDDSAIALIDRQNLNVVFEGKTSQNDAHKPFGGVVPELAARLHAENLPKLLEGAKPHFPQVEALAVTNEPGLTVALAEGVIMAQALSLALNKPILPINHIKGHIYSLFIGKADDFPLSAVMVSGGHTLIIEAEDFARVSQAAISLDDAFGEAFDKVAKALSLTYPNGAALEIAARSGDENRFDFPLPLKNDPRLAFSFSGLKNSVRLAIESQKAIDGQTKADIAASFQKAAIAHLLDKTRRYMQKARPKKMGLIGGASANAALRDRFGALCGEFDCEPLFAPIEYCGDNAAMIARAAIDAYDRGLFCDPSEIKIRSRVLLSYAN
ncbi:MAG: tRNA (adenosine(37)-N6)-threonylcarbamoyltransferase complex transferase subunit TsaD [Helicobacteraceae bacterium]|nr:tRNA (adenosine(37)-N6)-threonylcarbamoyltransferase complex transferase subunit TsaD [Helicobacteraceae bacterium]